MSDSTKSLNTTMTSPIFINYEISGIEQINTPEGRLYKTPTGKKYPSATTILGIESAKFIAEWRERVGAEVANEISRKASTRGTKVHEACEAYLKNQEFQWGMFDANPQELYSYMKPVLESIEEIHALETRLYSDKLQTAGTVDLICKINGKMTILDWKTSARFKTRDDIHSYFKQCSFYAQAFHERTGVLVPTITIAMAVDGHGLILFEERVIDWLPGFIETREKFRNLRGF